jgi:hypothetical protein
MNSTHQGYTTKAKGAKPNSSCDSTFIQQNKVEKKNVGVVGFIRKTIVPIHHKPQLPTLIPTNHVPIVMHMGMMPIIASHFT